MRKHQFPSRAARKAKKARQRRANNWMPRFEALTNFRPWFPLGC